VSAINKEMLEHLKINQFNNGAQGFICCCVSIETGEIIVSSIESGDFKRYDQFMTELITIFDIETIEERDY
jgi:hypothetical protein